MKTHKVNIFDIGENLIENTLLKSPPGPRMHQESSWHYRYFVLIKVKEDNQSYTVRVSKGKKNLDKSRQGLFIAYWESQTAFNKKEKPIRILPLYSDVSPCKRLHPINSEKYRYVFTLDILPRRLFLCAETENILEMWLKKISEHLKVNNQYAMSDDGQDEQIDRLSVWNCSSESSVTASCDESSATSNQSENSNVSFSAGVFGALSRSLSINSVIPSKINIRRYTTSDLKTSNDYTFTKSLATPSIKNASLEDSFVNLHDDGENGAPLKEKQSRVILQSESFKEEKGNRVVGSKLHPHLVHKRSLSMEYMKMESTEKVSTTQNSVTALLKVTSLLNKKDDSDISSNEHTFIEKPLSKFSLKKKFKTPKVYSQGDLTLHEETTSIFASENRLTQSFAENKSDSTEKRRFYKKLKPKLLSFKNSRSLELPVNNTYSAVLGIEDKSRTPLLHYRENTRQNNLLNADEKKSELSLNVLGTNEEIKPKTDYNDNICNINISHRVLEIKDIKVSFPTYSKIVFGKEYLELTTEETKCTFHLKSNGEIFNSFSIS